MRNTITSKQAVLEIASLGRNPTLADVQDIMESIGPVIPTGAIREGVAAEVIASLKNASDIVVVLAIIRWANAACIVL